MSDLILDKAAGDVRALHAVAEGDLDAFLAGQPAALTAAAALQTFKAKAGQVLVAPADEGGAVAVLGLGKTPKAEAFRAAPARLPAGDYRLAVVPSGLTFEAVALAWAMGGYRFERYRKPKDAQARLVAPAGADLGEVRHVAASLALARDLINTPANDMGPVEMEMAAREVAEAFGAEIGVVVGDDLLAQGYPAVHAVGRAADPRRAPRMIEIAWGKARHPLVALVGKGVVFDTGGLDLKTVGGHAPDEEGHGRRGACAGAGAHGDGGKAARAPRRAACRWWRTRSLATPCGPATCSPRARGSRSRSATPTPRAA